MHSHPADDAAFTNILLFSSAFSSSEEDPSFSIVFSVSVKQSVSFLGIMGSFTLSLLASKYVSWRGRGGKEGMEEEGGGGRQRRRRKRRKRRREEEEEEKGGGRGEGRREKGEEEEEKGGGGGGERKGRGEAEEEKGGGGGERRGQGEAEEEEEKEKRVRNSSIPDLQAQRLTYDSQCSVALLSQTSDDLWEKWVQSLYNQSNQSPRELECRGSPVQGWNSRTVWGRSCLWCQRGCVRMGS